MALALTECGELHSGQEQLFFITWSGSELSPFSREETIRNYFCGRQEDGDVNYWKKYNIQCVAVNVCEVLIRVGFIANINCCISRVN